MERIDLGGTGLVTIGGTEFVTPSKTFQLVVEHAIDDDNWKKTKSQRQAWIAALQQGQNPLTPEVLKQLLEESDESIEKLVN